MKKLYILLFTLFLLQNGYAQNNVGIGTNTPNPAAKLDITSTTQGLLPPRMTTVQRNAISAGMTGPQMAAIQGLTIYNTNSLCLESFIGITWQPIGCGCSSAPVKPGAIAGTFPICQGSTGVAFSINAVFGATDYTWSIPGTTGTIVTGNGSTAITVDFLSAAITGTLTVIANNSCGSSPASTQSITVNKTPTLASATQAATVCEGNTANINLTGLIAGTNSVSYSINGSAQTPEDVIGLSNPFSTPALIASNNGQTLQITGITQTSLSPQCAATFAKNVTLAVNPTPTLSTAAQAAAVCDGTSATINLSGLIPSSSSTIAYKINGVAQTPKTGVVADGSGNASFTNNLVIANNGQTLLVTGITRTDLAIQCSSGAIAISATLAVIALPATPAINGATYVGANQIGVSYSIASPVGGVTYTWTASGGGGAIVGGDGTTGTSVTVTWTGGTLGVASSTPTTISATPSTVSCTGTAGTKSATQGGKQLLTYTGSNQNWGGATYEVTTTNVQLWGAGGATAGANNNFSSGGSGGYTTGTLSISAGTALTIIVGQGGKSDATTSYGGGGANGLSGWGGGGGGRSAILKGATEVATAGGGGGSGYAYPATSYGGAGGGATGGSGGIGNGNVAATGGTQSAGGTRGSYSGGHYGVDGSAGTGGKGSGDSYEAGGGGGGYFGGGGGGGWYGGGGGGGSSYYDGLDVTGRSTTAGTTGTGAQTLPGYKTGDYVTGIGTGGSNKTNGALYAGGNGYVVIKW